VKTTTENIKHIKKEWGILKEWEYEWLVTTYIHEFVFHKNGQFLQFTSQSVRSVKRFATYQKARTFCDQLIAKCPSIKPWRLTVRHISFFDRP